ncbi:serine hydrolase domain-containing protein [Qipengyuania sp. MTN3-11]|uniref:serine hydrolase domain-containing protein n=1 Tax=Qipengyuania sp. MTN3-11 TaxID=3056557 RepID=UPI0036F4414A
MHFRNSITKGWAALAAIAALVGTATLSQDLAPQGPGPVESEAQGVAVPEPANGNGAQALTAEDANAWLEGFMSYALPKGDIAGAVVAIVQDGEIVTVKGYGLADVESRTPVDAQRTLFRPGSISKLVTWTAVMQQVEQGRIDLDADVNRYLDFEIPERNGEPVTMRNIMTHTAGFEEQIKQLIVDKPTPSYDALLKRWVPERIFDAGTTPAYSNYATSLAGYIVERVSGEPFDDYVENHIFEPLGMENSTFRQPLPERLEGQMASGYSRASQDPIGFEYVGPAPAGSLSSTGPDMARFMMAHLNNGELDGQRILRPETARYMHTTALDMIPGLDRMLLGFFETDINGRDVIAHLGDTGGFHSSLHLFLDENTGLYASFNSGGAEGAVNSVRISLFEQFADRYFPGDDTPIEQGVTDEEAREHARMMAGNWVASRRADSTFLNITQLLGQTTVTAGPDGELKLPPGATLNGQTADWVEVAPFFWRDRNSHAALSAIVEDGEVQRFSMSIISAFTVFERPVWYKNSALLMPLLYAALAVLLLTAVLWPVRALVRRHYKAGFPLEGRQLLAYRLSRGAALLILLVLAGWAVIMSMLFSDTLGAMFDGILVGLQVLTLVAFVGGTAVFAWNLWLAWKSGYRWPGKLWSLVLLLAGVVILWVGLAFHLIGFGTNY